ncbi:hypothetical protein [Sulfurimonas sp.]|uniref:hypothetical protein n=1 Tax=Sulfurimonas sp. TaxID=2022749 RepID=UPI003D0CF1B3
MNNEQTALFKIQEELNKRLFIIKELCKNSTFGELAYFLYYIHTIRTLKINDLNDLTHMSIDRGTDVYKYIISCIYKYSNISIPTNDYEIEKDKVLFLTKIGNSIHNFHEYSSLFTLIDDFEMKGENNRYARIDFTKSLTKNPNKQKAIQYDSRLEEFTASQNKTPLQPDELLENFKKKYTNYNKISKDIFGLSIQEISVNIKQLLNNYLVNIKNNEQHMTYFDNGNLDVQSIETIRQVIKSYIVDENYVLHTFGKKGMSFIRNFTFKKSDFKSFELNYHYLERRPLLKIKNKYIIVPELLLDSLFTNFHYSIIENIKYKEKHKQIMSDFFVDDIIQIAKKYNFSHSATGIELYKRKNKLGDIDLILKNDDYDILIEAKNHSLPLNVYFGNFEQLNQRLKQLQNEWEQKVNQRYEHLLENHEKYNIRKKFKYLIVSRFPEILAHHSNYLVLSIDEFDFYLQNNAKYENFDTFYKERYPMKDWNEEQMMKFMQESLNMNIHKENEDIDIK